MLLLNSQKNCCWSATIQHEDKNYPKTKKQPNFVNLKELQEKETWKPKTKSRPKEFETKNQPLLEQPKNENWPEIKIQATKSEAKKSPKRSQFFRTKNQPVFSRRNPIQEQLEKENCSKTKIQASKFEDRDQSSYRPQAFWDQNSPPEKEIWPKTKIQASKFKADKNPKRLQVFGKLLGSVNLFLDPLEKYTTKLETPIESHLVHRNQYFGTENCPLFGSWFNQLNQKTENLVFDVVLFGILIFFIGCHQFLGFKDPYALPVTRETILTFCLGIPLLTLSVCIEHAPLSVNKLSIEKGLKNLNFAGDFPASSLRSEVGLVYEVDFFTTASKFRHNFARRNNKPTNTPTTLTILAATIFFIAISLTVFLRCYGNVNEKIGNSEIIRKDYEFENVLLKKLISTSFVPTPIQLRTKRELPNEISDYSRTIPNDFSNKLINKHFGSKIDWTKSNTGVLTNEVLNHRGSSDSNLDLVNENFDFISKNLRKKSVNVKYSESYLDKRSVGLLNASFLDNSKSANNNSAKYKSVNNKKVTNFKSVKGLDDKNFKKSDINQPMLFTHDPSQDILSEKLNLDNRERIGGLRVALGPIPVVKNSTLGGTFGVGFGVVGGGDVASASAASSSSSTSVQSTKEDARRPTEAQQRDNLELVGRRELIGRVLIVALCAGALTLALGVVTCVLSHRNERGSGPEGGGGGPHLPPRDTATPQQASSPTAANNNRSPTESTTTSCWPTSNNSKNNENNHNTAPMLSVVSASAAAAACGGMGGMEHRYHHHHAQFTVPSHHHHHQQLVAAQAQMQSHVAVRRELAAQRDRQVRLQSVHRDLQLDLPPSIRLPDGEELPYGSSNRLQLRDAEQESEIYQKCIRPPPNRTVFESESPPPYRSSSAGLLGSLASSSSTTSSDWSTLGNQPLVVRCHSLSSRQRPDNSNSQCNHPQQTTSNSSSSNSSSSSSGSQKTDFLQRTVKIFTGKKTQQQQNSQNNSTLPTPQQSAATSAAFVIVPNRTSKKSDSNVNSNKKTNI